MSYIGNAPIVSATRTITEITATAGQTVFIANGGYTVGYIDVIQNGSQLNSTDFIATDGSSITLVSPATTGDDIRLVAWGTFNTGSITPAFKNRLQNGGMVIDQRNVGAVVTEVSLEQGYPVDRFFVRIRSTGSGHTTQRSSTAPDGFVNSALVTIGTGASPTSSRVCHFGQYIEGRDVADLGWGTANAKTITLSFWVRSSLTGTFSGALSNVFGAFLRSYPFTYTISSANTFEYKTITIGGDKTGTWSTDNTVGMAVSFDLGSGASFQGTAGSWQAGDRRAVVGCTKLVETSGATFYITGVQLEKGVQATEFERRPYQQELALCQRYYWKSFPGTTAPAFNAGDTGALSWTLAASGAIIGGTQVTFPVTMRTTPSITYFNPLAANANVRDNAGDGGLATTFTRSDSGFFVYGTANAGNTGANIGRIHATATDPLF